MDAVIQTEGLTKVYKDFWGRPKHKGLDSLSISIKPGEVFGLIGPNGSGKTTPFTLLIGLIFPTAGKATILGEPPTGVSANARLGFLREESYLNRWRNADEAPDFFGRLCNLDRRSR